MSFICLRTVDWSNYHVSVLVAKGIGRKDRTYFARLSSPQQQHFDFILCPDTVPLQLALNFVVA